MGSQPWAADWEHIVARDLIPHLIPDGQLRAVHRPARLAWLRPGAHADLSASAGPVSPEDLLVIPASAWQWDWWRRLSLYTPPSVAGIGERGVALWVQALPDPGVRVQVPFSELAAIEQVADGPWRVLIVTGREVRLVVRYHQDAEEVTDAWARRLRLRAAPVPAPVPPAAIGDRDRDRDRRAFLLVPGDEIVWAGRDARAGRGPSLLAVTSRELVIVRPSGPWGRVTRTLYVPRGSIECASIVSGTVLLRTAGTDLRVPLHSRKATGAASAWLSQVPGGQDRSSTGS
jgi:hypothetical protein